MSVDNKLSKGVPQNLESVLGLGNRGIKFIDVESAETFNYDFELEDRGKFLITINDSELLNGTLTVSADLFALDDELMFSVGSGNFVFVSPSSSDIVIQQNQKYSAVRIDEEDGFNVSYSITNLYSLLFLNYFIPTLSTNYVDDAAAAAGGVPIGGLYQTAGVVKIRLT